MMISVSGLSLAFALNTNPHQSPIINNLPVAAVETRQGFYKEYTVEQSDNDKAVRCFGNLICPEHNTYYSNQIDNAKSGYKTAEETEESKTKYWVVRVLSKLSYYIH